MEEILKRMIEQLQSLEWGEAQENVDGAIAYLNCAWQNLRNQQSVERTVSQEEPLRDNEFSSWDDDPGYW